MPHWANVCGRNRAGPVLLQKGLHLSDIRRFTVQQPLGKRTDLRILLLILVKILEPLNHPTRVSLDHHACDFGVGISVAELHSRYDTGGQPLAGLYFPELPAALGGQCVRIGFNGIIFPQLCLKCFSKTGPHGGIQYFPDGYLPCLRCFQNRTEHLPIVFHVYHHFQYNQSQEKHA